MARWFLNGKVFDCWPEGLNIKSLASWLLISYVWTAVARGTERNSEVVNGSSVSRSLQSQDSGFHLSRFWIFVVERWTKIREWTKKRKSHEGQELNFFWQLFLCCWALETHLIERTPKSQRKPKETLFGSWFIRLKPFPANESLMAGCLTICVSVNQTAAV